MKKTLLYLFISIFCFLSFTEAKGQFTNPFEEFISTFNDGATLNGRVYLDINGNGTQDASEPGIENVIIILINNNNNAQSTLTDENGDWTLNVPAGNTIVFIANNTLPPGAVLTQGTVPSIFEVDPGEVFDVEHFGYFQVGTIQGNIYLDINGNGTQDPDENGISGVEVFVTDEYGNAQTVTTNNEGFWQAVVGTGNVTSDINQDGPNFPTGAIQTEGTDPSITFIPPGQVTFSENDGFYPAGTIEGTLYFDSNGNGTQDAGENGITNVTIEALDELGNINTTVTDENGSWSFILPEGEATVTIDEFQDNFPTGATQTEGTNPTNYTIINAESYSQTDGFFEFGIIEGIVYLDQNSNGTQDAGENGIPNLILDITTEVGVSLQVTTDTNGEWSAEVPLGNTIISIDETQNVLPTYPFQTEGTNPTVYQVLINETYSQVDGFTPGGLLEGLIYLDSNNNGQQDSGEEGISNIEVSFENSLGGTTLATTNQNGIWEVILPIGDAVSFIDITQPNFPANAIQTEGTNPTTTLIEEDLVSNEVNGFFAPEEENSTITGRVYLDINGNGTQDTNEVGIADVEIFIEEANGINFSVTTDINGDFSAEVEAGEVTYEINTNDPNFPENAIQTEGTNPTTITAVENETTFGGNNGFFVPDSDLDGILTGLVYLDANGNGTLDPGEEGIANVVVQFIDSNGNFTTTETNQNGIFSTQIEEGFLLVEINENLPDFPIGAIQTDGNNPILFNATGGQINITPNFGYFIPNEDNNATLEGLVYLDENGNGTQDDGEVGIDNVEIVITEESGNSFSVFTNNDGDFSAQVVTGNISYEINTNDPNFPENTIQTEGTNPTTVNALPNANTFGGNNGFFVPSDDLESLINGRVYFDANGNGIQDDEEEGIADIPINIIDGLGNEITVNTDANGDFQASVVAGNIFYEIDEESPNFPTGATQTEGTNPTTVFVAPNTNTFVGNNGFFIPTTPPEPANLISRWYVDSNGNGSLDPGEPFLSGLDVTVTDSFGNTQTVVVNAQGFTVAEIFAGNVTFEIDETQPGFPEVAIQTEGTNPTTVFVSPNTTLYTGNNGFFVPSSEITIDLNGIVYFDANGNGTQDDDEEGITNVEVEIIDGIGVQWQVFTDEDGVFSVTVAAGEINVLVDENSPEIPVGSVLTEGTNPLETLIFPVDNPFIGSYGFFTPEETETTISGIVYFDENGNGIQDDAEPGLEEISVDIIDGEGNLIVVTTNEEGIFSAEVQIGNIVIDVDESSPNFPQGAVQTEGVNPLEININMESDSFIGSFGYFVPVIERTISGLVYLDQNGNGQQDAGEPGIENIPIEIIDGGGNLVGAITVQDGFFSVAVQIGDISILVDESDVNFPQGAVQTEGQNPLEISINEDDDAFVGNFGYFVDDTEEPEDGIRIFNAVSPNGSGQNQFFRIEGLSAVSNTNVQIFNREGVKVYDVDNYGFGSNLFRGVSEGRITFQRNKLLPTGTYFYLLRYTDEDGVRQKKQGYLYLIN